MPERLKQKTDSELFEVKPLGEESLMEMKAEIETIGLESTFRSPNIVPHQRYPNQHATPLVTS
jgi:DNA-directed RNA polymerase alpha subunit